MIITIDGPIATGKSTIAKKLAEDIGYIYFDTGAMYRCLTYGILAHHIDIHNKEQLHHFLETFSFDIKIRHGVRHFYYENEDITIKIRGEEVTSFVSEVSALKEVRDKLVGLQQRLAVGVNAVFEGRDMGTVVFPDAQLKIFLTGRDEVRAQRRLDELKVKFPEQAATLTIEKVLSDINARDKYDSERELSPLRKAEDAFTIDTSDMTTEEIVLKILEYKDEVQARHKRVHH